MIFIFYLTNSNSNMTGNLYRTRYSLYAGTLHSNDSKLKTNAISIYHVTVGVAIIRTPHAASTESRTNSVGSSPKSAFSSATTVVPTLLSPGRRVRLCFTYRTTYYQVSVSIKHGYYRNNIVIPCRTIVRT